MGPKKKKPNYYHIGSLENGINILKVMAQGGAMTLSEIAARTDMDRSGCHRYLLTFRDLGLAAKEESGGYRLTPMLFEISMTYVNRLEVRQVVRPFMEEMSQKYAETVNLAMKDGDHIVFLEKIQSTRNYRAEISTGTRHPLYCTALGKAILAFQARTEREAYMERHPDLKTYTPKTITAPGDLSEELAATRARGFSIDDEEYFSGLRCVAAPVMDRGGLPNYSIGLAGPSSRFGLDLIEEIGRDLNQLSGRICEQLGRTTPQ